jgi:hypothetical protein
MRNSITALFAAMTALAAPGAPIPAPAPPAPQVAAIDGTAHRTVDPGCDCATSYRTAHRYEGSSSRERAETSRLNRQFLESARAAARASAPAPDAAQRTYQEQLKNYRVLSDSYERRMRDYSRLHAQADAGWQDAARADPWHGYNPRGVNGY